MAFQCNLDSIQTRVTEVLLHVLPVKVARKNGNM